MISHGVTTHRWSSFDTLITGQAQADAIKSEVDAYEAAVSRTVAWVAFAHEWNSDGRAFPSIVVTSIKSRGATPLIFLNLRTVIEGQTDPLYNLAAINAGQFDSDLSVWADEAKNFGSELIVDWGWEMNIEQPWNGVYNGGDIEGPRRFREAYRHIIELMRNRGATNIRWAFHINFPESPAESWNAFENYYPGDDVIDSIGVSIYSAQMPTDTFFTSFAELMEPAYSRLIAMAPTKPVFVFEFGVTAGNPLGNSGTWADEALAGILSSRWPAVRGFAWWNDYWENDSDPSHDTEMRVEVVPGLAAVFQSRLSASNVGDRPPVFEYLGQIGPTIKANGQTDSITVSASNTVTITVEMNVATYPTEVPVDWWIVASANSSLWFYMNSALQWTEAPYSGDLTVFHPVYQGPLVDLSSTTVLPAITLPPGTYYFWFAVDYPLDGVLNINGPILTDSVNVTVQ